MKQKRLILPFLSLLILLTACSGGYNPVNEVEFLDVVQEYGYTNINELSEELGDNTIENAYETAFESDVSFAIKMDLESLLSGEDTDMGLIGFITHDGSADKEEQIKELNKMTNLEDVSYKKGKNYYYATKFFEEDGSQVIISSVDNTIFYGVSTNIVELKEIVGKLGYPMK